MCPLEVSQSYTYLLDCTNQKALVQYCKIMASPKSSVNLKHERTKTKTMKEAGPVIVV